MGINIGWGKIGNLVAKGIPSVISGGDDVVRGAKTAASAVSDSWKYSWWNWWCRN
jgi:hypothetical protein